MKDWKTTLCGLLAALSFAGFADCGLPDPWPKILALLCAAALSALGYHATDCSNCPGKALKVAAAIAAIGFLTLATGCALGRLTLKVASPAFGSVSLSVGDTVIGNPGTNGMFDVGSTNGR
jgi:hypothetical protein